ncbi:hypothetical protein ACN469_12880 [Corallococcus terminator]
MNRPRFENWDRGYRRRWDSSYGQNHRFVVSPEYGRGASSSGLAGSDGRPLRTINDTLRK